MTATQSPQSTAGPPGLAGPPPGTSARRDDLDELATRRVVPLRHPGRWLASVVVLVLLAQTLHGLVVNPVYQWDRFQYWFLRPVILDGLRITLEVTAWSALIGLTGGILLAIGRLSRNQLLRTVSWGYVWLFRSIPWIVLLLFLYNFTALYPQLSLGIPFGPGFTEFETTDLLGVMVLAVLGLSLKEAAYAAEVVRAGVLSVDDGQREAATALGLSRGRQFRRILLPQALRAIVPAYVNQLIGLIKASSLVFYVSLLDLFGTVQSMGATYPSDIIPLLVVATVWYLILTSAISVVQYYVERHYSRGAVRNLPRTPLQQVRDGVTTVRARLAEPRRAS